MRHHRFMSFHKFLLVLLGACGACTLASACTYQLPTMEQGGAGGGMPVDWWDAAWAHRIRITFQNAGGEALADFPVMVRLDGMRMPNAQASPSGADLRFVDDDGQTILHHEIDRWKPGSESFVWVRVPNIDATNTDHIWLYYGNPEATGVEDAAAVWNGFIGVYHLSPSDGMPTQFPDSAGVKTGGWFNGQAGAIVAGPINHAIGLDGVRFVHIGTNNNVAANPGQARTVEAWMNASQLQEQAVVYEEGECVGWYLGMNAKGHYLGNFITDPVLPLCGAGTSDYAVTTPASAGTWHYVALVVDRPGLEMRLFVDGIFAKSTPINNMEIADGNGVFRIGSDYDGGAGTFVGSIDEVRVSSSARSAGWIAAQHKSMTDHFLSFEAE